jgi:hypothetical protein
VFAGVAAETIDNSAGSPGDKSIRVSTTGDFTFKTTGLAQTNMGDLAYADLGNTDAGQRVLTTPTSAKELAVGRFAGLDSATVAIVRINGFAFSAGVAPNGIHGLDD